MFSFIKYENSDEYDVVPTKNVLKIGKRKCSVKSGPVRFEADLIAENDDKKFLLKLKIKREKFFNKNGSCGAAKQINESKSSSEPTFTSNKICGRESRRYFSPLFNSPINSNENKQQKFSYNLQPIFQSITVPNKKKTCSPTVAEKYFLEEFSTSLKTQDIQNKTHEQVSHIPNCSTEAIQQKFPTTAKEYVQEDISSSFESPILNENNQTRGTYPLFQSKTICDGNILLKSPEESFLPFKSATISKTKSQKSALENPPLTFKSKTGTSEIIYPNSTAVGKEYMQLIVMGGTTSPLLESPIPLTENHRRESLFVTKDLQESPTNRKEFSSRNSVSAFHMSTASTQFKQQKTQFANDISQPECTATNTLPQSKSTTNFDKYIPLDSVSCLQNSEISFEMMPQNNTEKSNISESTIYVQKESGSEYIPDSTAPTQSSKLNNTCSEVLIKSVSVIPAPVEISKVNVPNSNKTKKYILEEFSPSLKTQDIQNKTHEQVSHLPNCSTEAIQQKFPTTAKEYVQENISSSFESPILNGNNQTRGTSSIFQSKAIYDGNIVLKSPHESSLPFKSPTISKTKCHQKSAFENSPLPLKSKTGTSEIFYPNSTAVGKEYMQLIVMNETTSPLLESPIPLAENHQRETPFATKDVPQYPTIRKEFSSKKKKFAYDIAQPECTGTNTLSQSKSEVSFDIMPHKSTEKSNISESTTFVQNEIVSEYIPDSTAPTQSSNLNNTCSEVLEKSLSVITSPEDSVSCLQNSEVSFEIMPHNSTEKSNISESTIFVQNESVSEYIPDSTAPTQSSNLNNNCSEVLEKSVSVISSPVDISKVNVPYSNKTKKHFCLFCKTMQTKIVRHFLLKHKNEQRVKVFSKLPKKHKDRLKIISELRKEGDFMHNTNKSVNTGILIVIRQQTSRSKNKADDYVCCKNCKGFFSRRTLKKHVRRCGQYEKNVRTNFSAGRRLTQYIHADANEILRTTIFPTLRVEEITNVIRYDELIIKYGNKLAEKYTLVHQHDMIRSHLRLLGRFKIAVRELCPEIEELKEIFKPQMFDTCVTALRKVANWDTSAMWFKTPAVATSLTSLVKKCGSKQRAELIKMQKEEEKKHLEDFLLLWEEEIPTLINKKACEDQANQKRAKKNSLPSKEDIKKLYDFLKNALVKHMKTLEKGFCEYSWTELIKHALIFIQLFNRRRAGEIERIKISSYKNRETITDNAAEEDIQNFSEESLTFAKQYVRLTTRGKLGRSVGVLLCPLAMDAVNMIVKYREIAGISQSNDFIFCKSYSSKLSKGYFRACPLLKQFASECGANIPESLRGTNLRKHIATHISLLNVEESAVDKLANFMGHHKDIHKNVYRISVPVAEITCVAKLLMNAIGDDNDDEEEENDEENDEENVVENVDIEELERTSDAVITNLSVDSDSTERNTGQVLNKKKRSTSPFGKTRRVRWNTEEREAIKSHFGCVKELEKLPSLSECFTAINKYEALKNRTPQVVKTWIHNQKRDKKM